MSGALKGRSDGMTGESEQAIEHPRRLLADAALFHLKSIPLPVKIVEQLVAMAEIASRNPMPRPNDANPANGWAEAAPD